MWALEVASCGLWRLSSITTSLWLSLCPGSGRGCPQNSTRTALPHSLQEPMSWVLSDPYFRDRETEVQED